MTRTSPSTTLSNKAASTLLLLASAAALSGCFGGSDDAAAADPLAAVPASASQSTSGTVDYLAELARNPSETAEAIDVTALVLPTSETEEPRAVD